MLYFAMMCLFVYSSLDATVSLNITFIPQITQMTICLLSIALFIFSPNKGFNSFYKLFAWWLIYYSIAYLLTPHYDIGITGYFRVTWFINAFLITYICCRRIENPTKLVTIAFALIILINVYFVYLNLFDGIVSLDIEEIGVSNLVFWSFCAIPVLFLIKNPLYRNSLLVLTAVICLFTMKRSAFIALAGILFFYYISSRRMNNSVSVKKNRKLTYVVCFIGIISLIIAFQDQFFEILQRNFDRLDSIQEDRGSNRLTVWDDVIKAFDYNSTFDWIIGNGMGSTYFKAKHTTAHNDFLTVLFEFGIIGLLFYLVFMIKVLKRAIEFWKNYSEYTMCLVSSIIILFVVGNVGDLFTCYSYLAYITILLGAIEAKASLRKI